jgi:hypothetical protein
MTLPPPEWQRPYQIYLHASPAGICQQVQRKYSPFWHWIRFITATGRTVPIWPSCVTLTLRPFQVRISVVATRNAIFPGTDGAPL